MIRWKAKDEKEVLQMTLGTIQTMRVLRKIETGYVLGHDGQEALLHHNETHQPLIEGEEVKVFLYSDKKGNIAATTTIPNVTIQHYGWAEVVEVVPKLGVFVNIGIQKEMLVSNDELPKFRSIWPKPEDRLYVKLDLDDKNRLMAIPATGRVIADLYKKAPETLLNQVVGGRGYFSSREGTEIITMEGYRGFIHHTERKSEPRLGELVKGRVIDVKEDGTINVSLRPIKRESIPIDAEDIIRYLRENGGVMPFSDKSDPEEIRATFQISKAAFKRALGRLMKEGKVEQRDDKSYLL